MMCVCVCVYAISRSTGHETVPRLCPRRYVMSTACRHVFPDGPRRETLCKQRPS